MIAHEVGSKLLKDQLTRINKSARNSSPHSTSQNKKHTLFCPFLSCFWSSMRRISISYSMLKRRDLRIARVNGFSAKYSLCTVYTVEEMMQYWSEN